MRLLYEIPDWLRVVTGAVIVGCIALFAHAQTGRNLVERLEARAERAIAENGGTGITADFTTSAGWPTRHPVLVGGEGLPDDIRARVARAVADLPGVGGAHWDSRSRSVIAPEPEIETGPFHCQRDVETLLSVRVIRFGQGSAEIDPESEILLDEVAGALKPCRGSIIAITGHSDAVGDASVNLRLSRERAAAVRSELVERGLPRDSLRATGRGSAQPIEGLQPEDPANRRIEFSVIEVAPLRPTPIDIPDAG